MACILSLWALRLLLCVDSTSVLSLQKRKKMAVKTIYNFADTCCCCCLTDATLLQCQDGLRTRKLCQSRIADHCCNSGIFQAASPRCFPYTTACQLTQTVVGYTAQDTALELGAPSGTGKLILLLLDGGTSRCTRFPPNRWDFSHTSPKN